MSNRGNEFLDKTLGEDFLESLCKVELWKPGTRTTLDHEEIKTALQIVPRTVMAMLIRELSPMNIGDAKDIPLFISPDAKMRVAKNERDVYSGDIVQDNRKIAEFKYRSLPSVGLVILSTFELYDIDTLHGHQHIEVPEDAESKIQKLIDERLMMHDLINRVVDHKLIQKEAVHQLVLSRLTQELSTEKEEAEKARIQLAATGVAALGYATQEDTKPGDPGHSASFDDVAKLYKEHAKLKQDITDVAKVAKQSADYSEYMRGLANGLVVADSVANKKEPDFVEAPKKGSPLKNFLDSKKKKKEFSVRLSKGEAVHCPDCDKNIFDGKIFSGCVCLGDDMEKKVFIKKTEDGIKVRFSKGWDQENIEMLLEVLRRKNG